ncbi:MAG: nicotinate-nucleotide diphosphorylase (carboxylating) [Nitrospirae bacterium CG_4_10_14_3_um_filter_44_29]|nr:carboxylating nicotinate-nucleotide diphosphorylase [Nitrospirota bacterium]OIO29373.1 MAG: nicotinate-nucleotide diphosphorylase (carboxylating) [Nitrospirae bacterium CG1_02_44_142]PIP70612.1 MAG: nicotinate-nucleotide diphosphorylase (carboxylating) [Nitrospirae bacterium CG22_combo_CG10-13_8_21_14_all_44_11]PIV41758.1 MAG: nicotinate-nucleotide diphosphorylase (carboxylating) [Nitrospirae bacterium CG02_land_8_20_14_3_00_44_33]PIV66328.1 MAG: nicotinate-nucleotide diphosphorylase (carbox
MRIPHSVSEIIRIALEEDIGNGDITTAFLIPEDSESRALIIAKENFVVAGIPFLKEVFNLFDGETKVDVFINDGSKVMKGDVIAEVSGRTRVLLSGERVSLNLLQRLSGIATLTNMFVEKVRGLHAKIVDTRKTTPGLRFMEKYAVRAGGGNNHRFGLFDGILIKDNHIEAVGSITEALRLASEGHHLAKIEVEVENLKELKEAVEEGADIVMLDNMSVKDMKEAVKIVHASKKDVILEASGNVSLENVREVAETGVDLISIGALTHSATAVDISMKIVK